MGLGRTRGTRGGILLVACGEEEATRGGSLTPSPRAWINEEPDGLARGVKADARIIKASSGRGKSELKGGGGVYPGISTRFHILWRLRGTLVLVVVEGGMEGKNPLSREGNHGGRLSRWIGGDRGAGSFRVDDVDARMNGQGDEDPRERWFHQENFRAEIRTLIRLEDDLNLSLLFEHGRGQRASPLWIVHILLGRLSRERTTLDKAVEVFAKLQWRDIMQSMVKLHDLVDLAEPPWRGMAEASTSGLPTDEAMEMDKAIGNHNEEATDASASPREANLSFD